MKAIQVEQTGGPDVLQLREIAGVGKPGPGQAVVRIAAAGVNFIDIQQRRGAYPRPLPFTPGLEAAGVVESVGEGVSAVKPGDRVAYSGQPGAYAEESLVAADRRIALPADVSFEQGASFSVARHDGALPAPRVSQYQARRGRADPRRCRRDGSAADAVGASSGRARDRDGFDRGEGAARAGSRRSRSDSLHAAGFRRRNQAAHRRARSRSDHRRRFEDHIQG